MRVLFVLRKRAGITQLELATRVGITQTEISTAESGYEIRRLDRIRDELGKYDANRQDIPSDPKDLLLDWDEYRDRRRGLVGVRS